MSQQSLKSGIIWSSIERFSVQGVSFILSLIISRLVTPGEYGLIAMLSIFMAIAQAFIDSGFGSALIQKKDRNEVDYSTVFYFNIIVSFLLYILLYYSAPLIANFYCQPKLINITRWVGLNLILNSFCLVQRTKLYVSMKFQLLAKVSLTSVVISGVIGIGLAYYGYGVWSLVVQGLSCSIITTSLLWIVTKWRPLILFSIDSFKRLFSFGSKLLASGLLHTIYLNLYSLVIGKFYNATDVGYYNRAYSISQYPSTNIVGVVTRAMYPVQCEHQDDDDWLKDNFLKYLKMTCFIVFPLMVLLAVIAKPLVLILLTKKWLPSAPLISILSIAYMWYPVMFINYQMLNVKGRSDISFKTEVIKKLVAVIILIATLPFGVIWLCCGVLIYNLFDIMLSIAFSRKIIPIGYFCQLKSILPIFILSMLSGAVAWIFTLYINASFLSLILSLSSFIGIFLLGCKLLHIDEFKQLKQILNIK